MFYHSVSQEELEAKLMKQMAQRIMESEKQLREEMKFKVHVYIIAQGFARLN